MKGGRSYSRMRRTSRGASTPTISTCAPTTSSCSRTSGPRARRECPRPGPAGRSRGCARAIAFASMWAHARCRSSCPTRSSRAAAPRSPWPSRRRAAATSSSSSIRSRRPTRAWTSTSFEGPSPFPPRVLRKTEMGPVPGSHLELRHLTKRYGDLVSVDGIDLAVERGEFVCLLGPSGCGKTTTLRMIAGFLEPDGGEIRVAGKVVSAPGAVIPPERRNMSMIFQSYAVWPHMTVRDNVGYGLKMKKIAADQARERTDAMLKATRLFDYAARYPGELSGGQQQRVALARALAPNPD